VYNYLAAIVVGFFLWFNAVNQSIVGGSEKAGRWLQMSNSGRLQTFMEMCRRATIFLHVLHLFLSLLFLLHCVYFWFIYSVKLLSVISYSIAFIKLTFVLVFIFSCFLLSKYRTLTVTMLPLLTQLIHIRFFCYLRFAISE